MKRDLEFMLREVQASAVWRSPPVLACALAAAGILAGYWQTAASIVSIWIRSDTYAHGFIVIPICIWFAWRRRHVLAATLARPWWPGLALITAAGTLWFGASTAGAVGIKQFALAFMLQAAIVTVVGLSVARIAAFAIAFLLFAVPAGEFLIPTLIDWTADFTVNALRLSGIPVYREANQFVIPTGRWSVVDACSGVRYIVASFMVGTIFAAIAYRRPLRRAIFLMASLVVPVVANWLRAYMIVMLGHISDNRIAVGVDHIIYGWIFFGIVMLLLFWIGSFWQESRQEETVVAIASHPAAHAPNTRMYFIAAAAAIFVALVWLPLDAMVNRSGGSTAVPAIPAIDESSGWTEVRPFSDWRPNYAGFRTEVTKTYTRAGQQVAVYIAYYRDQRQGSQLVTSGNTLVSLGAADWKLIESGGESVRWLNRNELVEHAKITRGATRFEALSLYWIDGHVTSNPIVAKIHQAWSKLAGRGDDAALIVIYTPSVSREGAARDSLRAFTAEMSPSIDRALAGARDGAQ